MLLCEGEDASDCEFVQVLRTMGRIVLSTNQKASIDRWAALVHCLYIKDEDWRVCYDCDALEMKEKDSFASEFLQVLYQARDGLL